MGEDRGGNAPCLGSKRWRGFEVAMIVRLDFGPWDIIALHIRKIMEPP